MATITTVKSFIVQIPRNTFLL